MARALKAQRDMVAKALKTKRASADEMTKMLTPTESALAELEHLKSTGCEEAPDLRNHLQVWEGGSVGGGERERARARANRL